MQTPAYNAKPAPIHTGDFDAVGLSTVFQTSTGYALARSASLLGSGQSAAAVQSAPPVSPENQKQLLIGLAVIAAAWWWVDREARR